MRNLDDLEKALEGLDLIDLEEEEEDRSLDPTSDPNYQAVSFLDPEKQKHGESIDSIIEEMMVEEIPGAEDSTDELDDVFDDILDFDLDEFDEDDDLEESEFPEDTEEDVSNIEELLNDPLEEEEDEPEIDDIDAFESTLG